MSDCSRTPSSSTDTCADPAAKPGRGRKPGQSGRRTDTLEAWRLAETGRSTTETAALLGFTANGVAHALRGKPNAVDVRPRPWSSVGRRRLRSRPWSLVHSEGLDVPTTGRRLGVQPPAVLELLARHARHARVVREREWADLRLAGEDLDGHGDSAQARRHAYLVERVRTLADGGLETWIISEWTGVPGWHVRELAEETQRKLEPSLLTEPLSAASSPTSAPASATHRNNPRMAASGHYGAHERSCPAACNDAHLRSDR